MRKLTDGGEDSPVLGGEVAEGFSVELHGTGDLVKGWCGDVKSDRMVVV